MPISPTLMEVLKFILNLLAHLENEILGSANIGLNVDQNEAYLSGLKSITSCNSDFRN